MEKSPIASLLGDMPKPLPLYLSRFTVEVAFASSYLGQEDRRVIDDAFGELDALLKAGFFAWAYMDERARAGVSVEWRSEGFSVCGQGTGLHHNVLVSALRMVVSLHHTPRKAREELIAALGDDAEALPPRSVWSDLIRHIRLRELEGADQRTANRTDFDPFVPDDQIVLPLGSISDVSTDCNGVRLVARAQDGLAIPDKAHLASIEDDFLGVCNSGGFRDLSRLGEMPEEAAIFLRSGDRGSELVIDGYLDQYYGLVEFLNAMTKGRNAALVVD